MKIGIITFHSAFNYGAVLQCYALQETLKGMGHRVRLIDYRPSYLQPDLSITPHKILSLLHRNPLPSIYARLRYLLIRSEKKKYDKTFKVFAKQFELPRDEDTLDSYDTYIFGSDQIWNSHITHGLDPYYYGYLPFEKRDRVYVTYAASMGDVNFDEMLSDHFRKALTNFDAISVREEELQVALQPLTDKEIKVVLDPTLLAEPKIWEHIIKKPEIKEKYVFVYQVRIDKEALRIARKIAKDIGGIVIDSRIRSKILSRKQYSCYSPMDFLGWIKYASCVVTTSFHGTAFSVVFRKPFYSVSVGIGDLRLLSFLNKMGLQDRFIPKTSTPTFSPIDYAEAHQRLAQMRQLSMDFLRENLS
ncbi:MAG: polysaccharide pyruvyl transferase family protein [Prevotellaceae bacterium]|nr:polysaccharide pyruvyl transferase family protein [Prevotellaceae bacterium]